MSCAPLAFSLLGTPVVAHSSDPAARARLTAVYGTGADRPSTATPIEASLQPHALGFAVTVAGRPGTTAGDLVAAVRAFNHELMHAVMLRNQHLLFVHAGVVANDGRAVVLPGLSRAGKSTLVLALLREGARLLSDELLAYDPASGRLLPFPRAVKVRDECAGYFPEHAPHFVGEGEGRFLPLAALATDAVAGATRPGVVAAPRWDPHGDDDPRAITAGEGLLHLARSALNFGAQRERSVDHLAALAGGSACFTLSWRDPHAAARALLRCLERAPA
jgi:hypothetical protein